MYWLSERFSRNVPSEAALIAYDLPWSAVFTSSIDPNFARRFETRGRQPEAVLSAGTYARVSRSRSRPPIHYVLGKAGDGAADAAAPKSNSELKRRLSLHGTELLNRVAETATARGLIVIAGYDPASDWLELDELLAPLSDRAGVNILWFGATDIQASAFAEEMISAGSLTPEMKGFAIGLAQVQAETWLEFSASATPDEPSLVSISGGALDVTPALRLRVEASAAIVDDGWTATPEPLDGPALEDAFRRFHGDLGGFRSRIEGIGRGFAMRRPFETELDHAVEATLRRLAQTDGVVLVHGQSGTGKSVALARLALDVRERLKLPVLVASARIPAYSDVEGFCAEVERAGAPATVLICDTNHPVHRYRDLAAALQSRGRKLLIVGTSYRLDPKLRGNSRQYVEAPGDITAQEIEDLRNILQRFAPDLNVSVASEDRHSVLAMLYRSISHGREHLRARVSAEARSVENQVRERAKRVPTTNKRSHLADQLIAIGIASEEVAIFTEDTEAASIGHDAAGRLIDYVMVPGRLNCPVPLNLVMRVLGQNSGSLEVDQVLHLFSNLDLFRWHSANAEGSELLISPRLQLEAELICRSRLGDRNHEIGRLIDLISNVRPSGVDRQVERNFLLDLLQKLDRDGPRADEYRQGYLAFAETLTNLRQQNGVLDAPLMVRECVFRRQAIWSQDGSNAVVDLSEDEKLRILDDARGIVEEAFRLIEIGDLHASKRTRQNLASERASIYGYLAVQRSRLDDNHGSWSDYLAAKAASSRAMALSDDYHPVDIALWTSSDVLKSNKLSESHRAEVIADLYAALDIVDVDTLAADQQVRYYDRQTRVAALLEDHELSDSALASLEQLAPAAATFLRARLMAAPLDAAEPPYSLEYRQLAASAGNHIKAQDKLEIADDARCQRLLLRLRWAQATGERLLRSERGPTPHDAAEILELLSIVSGINERSSFASRNSERYLEAVLSWLAGDTIRALDIWKQLSRDSEFEDRSRVIRKLLASDSSGKPLKYRGRVEGVKGTSDWKVRVDGINTPINLLAHEFADQDLAHGRELRDFGIAFNYVGPVADPLTRPMSRR